MSKLTYISDRELRMWRAGEDITQVQAAARFGVSPRVYGYWEAGRFPKDLAVRFDAVVNPPTPKEPQVWFAENGVPLTIRDLRSLPIGAQLVRLRDDGSKDLMKKTAADGFGRFGIVKKGI